MHIQNTREIILEELALGPKIWSQLLLSVKKKKPTISQSTFYYHLTKMLRAKNIIKIDRPDGSRIYQLPKTEKMLEVSKQITEIETANQEELSFLLDTIKQAHTNEAIKQSFTDLKNIVRTKSVTSYRRIWNFLRDILGNKDYEVHWSELIECVQLILENARARNDDKSIKMLRNALLPRILEIANTPTRARVRSIQFIDDMLADDEKFRELKKIAENVIEKGDNVSDLYPLAKMYTKRKMEIWGWLYPLIDSDDPQLRERASELLSYMRNVANSS